MPDQEITEGHAPFSHPTLYAPASTWYQIHGSLAHTTRPLIVLHGGPGATHLYLTPLTALNAQHARTIIFYDQIGCGNSTRLRDKRNDHKFWTVELFVAELNNLIRYLEISEFDLLGHSWGGMLGADYAIRQNLDDESRGLRRLVISNSPASMALWVESCNIWRSELPADLDATIRKYEEARDYTAQPYLDAVQVFYQRHMCRIQHPNGVDPFPEPLMRMLKALEEDDTVYFSMNGPSEFTVIGNLNSWSVVGKLGGVRVPVLVINAEFDEARESAVRPFVDEIEEVEWVCIDGASHCAHVERTEEYVGVVEGWFGRHP